MVKFEMAGSPESKRTSTIHKAHVESFLALVNSLILKSSHIDPLEDEELMKKILTYTKYYRLSFEDNPDAHPHSSGVEELFKNRLQLKNFVEGLEVSYKIFDRQPFVNGEVRISVEQPGILEGLYFGFLVRKGSAYLSHDLADHNRYRLSFHTFRDVLSGHTDLAGVMSDKSQPSDIIQHRMNVFFAAGASKLRRELFGQ